MLIFEIFLGIGVIVACTSGVMLLLYPLARWVIGRQVTSREVFWEVVRRNSFITILALWVRHMIVGAA